MGMIVIRHRVAAPIRALNVCFGGRDRGYFTLFIRRCHFDLALLGFHPQNTRITLDFGSVTDWNAVPLWTKFKRVGVSVATRSSLP
jgi:hypothetical protein